MDATLQLMIDPTIKRSLGQMMKGVQVVGAHHDGVTRAYCSHWVCQVSFEEPIVMASVSPKHDTYPLLVASGEFAVSILAGDQVDVGQYFSYPGRKFRYIADEYLETIPGTQLPVVRNCIAWLRCTIVRGQADGRSRAVLRPGRRGRRRATEGATVAVLEPARLAGHRRQGTRPRAERSRRATANGWLRPVSTHSTTATTTTTD